MDEVVRIAQDKNSYRVYINMEHPSGSQGSVYDFVRLLPQASRKYHPRFRYWSVASYETSVLISFLVKNNIPYSLRGTISIDPFQTAISQTFIQRMKKHKKRKKSGEQQCL